ncbi:dihydrodipicolinate synthase family protein [Humitalea sp. 24SJ18S-53]|uniref:dihydrodipicolinate synthase family protein n=1 Tax=Humitalea sp. 24SJ18S-53 TaxID=3422307 RepID=UPI003D66AEB7
MTAFPLDRTTLGGYVPAVVTPFTPTGEIMEDGFAEIVGWLIDHGARGICVAGDNGESWTLSAAERARLTVIALKVAAGRVPVMTGCTAPSAAQSVAYARAAMEAGADGLLMMPQTYVLKATSTELLRRFEAVAKAVPLPIVAYNSPRRTGGVELSLDDLESLTGIAPIIGIKESNRDFFHHSHLLHRFRDRLAVMVGPCHFIFPGVALGAAGFIATGPELLGHDAGRIMQVGAQAPGPELAALHHKLTVAYQVLMGIGTWPAAFKAALNLMGLPAGVPRDPVLPLEADALETLKRRLSEVGLLG